MAQFVLIGKQVMNLDQVTVIRDSMHLSRPHVTVCFGDDNYLEFFAEEAESLLRFMRQQPDLNGVMADETYTVDTSEHPISCPCWKCEERRATK